MVELLFVLGLLANVIAFIGHWFIYSLSDWKKWVEETKVKHLIVSILLPVSWIFVVYTFYRLNRYSKINKIKKFMNKPIRKKGDEINGKV